MLRDLPAAGDGSARHARSHATHPHPLRQHPRTHRQDRRADRRGPRGPTARPSTSTSSTANKPQPAPADYDAVILGASIHAGHHQRALVKWAERHHTALDLNPSAFFSVCLTAADDAEEARAATRGYLDDFVEQTGWTPSRTATFAGALQYREYDVATRALMRLLMRRMHHPTDASQDYDYTDWDAVERWAHELAATLAPAVAGRRALRKP